ncbi:hypothetical protein [Cyclobacterium qasimii]|uniref:Lipoprotein n=2 Tax=Cyclobacterium qasimii TaxID=1350429 RepID=S7VJ62_9BACT|nr:hypothetical protein [Cyclobacterium qasimii]EPR69552.1 hypothetical protein ADICYQ_1337 [Cyclobacterium qasimii M12-11B]GEO21401.1 hypothetical protein CQA01_19350 [Cyclobacterium qasimii]
MRQPSLIDIISVILVTFAIVSCKQVSNSEGKVKTLPEVEQAFNQKEAVLNGEKPTANTPISNELSFLKAFNEKYPYEIKLLEEPVIKKRLEKMLGPQYAFVKSIWEVETPITIVDGMFYAWGMQAHSGGDPGAVLMADLNKNVLYVGIRKKEDEQFYSEDGSPVPQKLQDWADEQ